LRITAAVAALVSILAICPDLDAANVLLNISNVSQTKTMVGVLHSITKPSDKFIVKDVAKPTAHAQAHIKGFKGICATPTRSGGARRNISSFTWRRANTRKIRTARFGTKVQICDAS